MATLDGIVLEHMADRLFRPDRLTKILEAYIAQSSTDDATPSQKLGSARQRTTELKGAKNRLLDLVSSAIVEPDDPDLKDKFAALGLQRKQVEEEIALLGSSLGPARGGSHRNACLTSPVSCAKRCRAVMRRSAKPTCDYPSTQWW